MEMKNIMFYKEDCAGLASAIMERRDDGMARPDFGCVNCASIVA